MFFLYRTFGDSIGKVTDESDRPSLKASGQSNRKQAHSPEREVTVHEENQVSCILQTHSSMPIFKKLNTF